MDTPTLPRQETTMTAVVHRLYHLYGDGTRLSRVNYLSADDARRDYAVRFCDAWRGYKTIEIMEETGYDDGNIEFFPLWTLKSPKHDAIDRRVRRLGRSFFGLRRS